MRTGVLLEGGWFHSNDALNYLGTYSFTSLAAYDASASLSSAAHTTFDAALEAYRNGVGSITDVTVAETQLLPAKNAFTDAKSVALSAAATLALAAGALGSAPP